MNRSIKDLLVAGCSDQTFDGQQMARPTLQTALSETRKKTALEGLSMIVIWNIACIEFEILKFEIFASQMSAERRQFPRKTLSVKWNSVSDPSAGLMMNLLLK